MRHVRWTDEAVEHLTEIVDFLDTKSESFAQRVAQEIYDEGESLAHLSHRWRLGLVAGTRECVMPSNGYILTYEVIGEAVIIISVHHAAQDRPRR